MAIEKIQTNLCPGQVMRGIVDQCAENGDGVYFIYFDCISRDAARVLKVQGGEIVEDEHPTCFMSRDYYGDGGPCGIVPTIKDFLDGTSLKVFQCDAGYFSFRGEWHRCDWGDTLEKYGVASELLHVDVERINKQGDEKE